MGQEEQMLPEKSKHSVGEEIQPQPMVDMKGTLYRISERVIGFQNEISFWPPRVFMAL